MTQDFQFVELFGISEQLNKLSADPRSDVKGGLIENPHQPHRKSAPTCQLRK